MDPTGDALAPVFVLSGGGRTGSTLVQRLILSTRRILVWGEHGGAVVEHLGGLHNRLGTWLGAESSGGRHFDDFRARGANAWVANMNPPLPAFEAATRAYLDVALGRPARDLGFPRWGFKEIHYGEAAARWLAGLYPAAGFVVVVRHPLDCLRSIAAAPWYDRLWGSDPARFLTAWAATSGQLVGVAPRLGRAAVVRYEDLLASPAACVARVAGACGLPAEAFDLGTLAHRERGMSAPPAALTAADRAAAAEPEVRRVAAALGYRLDV